MNAPERAPVVPRAVTIRCIAGGASDDSPEPVFVFDGPDLGSDARAVCGVILTMGGEDRARELLVNGFPAVFVGEAGLHDSGVVERLARAFGPKRVGVYVPATRMRVSWSLDTVSNADFKVMSPSVCEPCWEILTADGRRTGALARWWIAEMLKFGASSVLVRADIRDDADLNICATLAEECGDRLWIGPREDEDPRFDEWVSLAKATRLVVPAQVYHASEHLAALRRAMPPEEQMA